MRILMPGNNHRAEIRGPLTFIHGLARTLVDRGHDVTLLQAARPEHRIAIDGVRMEYVGTTSKAVYPLRYALRRLGSFDVIHAHSQSGAGLALRSRLARVPLVTEFHDPHIRSEPFWQANPRWRGTALAAWYSPVRLTPTRWLAGGLAERFGLDPASFHVIPYGVRDYWFAAGEKRRERHGPPRVVLVNMKGVDVGLRAFAQATAGSEATLDLYGVHRDTERYRALAAALGLGSRARFHGFVQNEKLPDLLADAAVLLHPNRSGNMDQVLCESQTLGLPGVTSRVNGNPECVAEGESALLCPVDDVDAFASALRTLLGNAELRARFGAAARARALRVFAFGSVAARLESEIYEPLARGEIPAPVGPR